MVNAVITGLLIPFLGTSLGAACVLFMKNRKGKAEGPASHLAKTTMMVLAVVLHNIPEGMALGAVYAEYISGNAPVTYGGALALSLGIAIQNFPEGAIISMPLYAAGKTKTSSFVNGVLSGAVEPSPKTQKTVNGRKYWSKWSKKKSVKIALTWA